MSPRRADPAALDPLPDLRAPAFGSRVERALDAAEEHLRCTLDRARLVRKRRTVGGPSNRGTWVQVEARTHDRVRVQGWGGIEAAATLTGVAMPRWHRSGAWADGGLLWRADETELVGDPLVLVAGELTADPGLPDTWWATLASSLAALAAQPCAWPAKVNPTVVSQELITRSVAGTGVDATVDDWTAAHADLL